MPGPEFGCECILERGATSSPSGTDAGHCSPATAIDPIKWHDLLKSPIGDGYQRRASGTKPVSRGTTSGLPIGDGYEDRFRDLYAELYQWHDCRNRRRYALIRFREGAHCIVVTARTPLTDGSGCVHRQSSRYDLPKLTIRSDGKQHGRRYGRSVLSCAASPRRRMPVHIR